MTEAERAVIEAAVEWEHLRTIFGDKARPMVPASKALSDAINELHNESDGKWEPGDD